MRFTGSRFRLELRGICYFTRQATFGELRESRVIALGAIARV
jgi:hypothetical protein